MLRVLSAVIRNPESQRQFGSNTTQPIVALLKILLDSNNLELIVNGLSTIN